MIRNVLIILIGSLLLISLSGCKESKDAEVTSGGGTTGDSRSFQLGFTPWPYEATTTAIDNVYSAIQLNGDIVAHHLQDGVPWVDASNDIDRSGNYNAPYKASIDAEVNSRLSRTQSGKKIYLAIDAISGDRKQLNTNWKWNDLGQTQYPTGWDPVADIDNPVVYNAYANFAVQMIYRFDPEYFNYASELSDILFWDDPNAPTSDRFDKFVTFAQNVYPIIKAYYPNLKVMISVALKTPDSTKMDFLKAHFYKIAPYVDIVGVSTYGYAFYSHSDKGNPNNLPSNWLSQIKDIVGNKPIAITETGWIAENLNIAAYPLIESSTPTFQNDYLNLMFSQADALDTKFIIWFTAYDFDTLWTNTLGQDNLSRIWRDTGLYDENLVARPALATWKKWYGYPVK